MLLDLMIIHVVFYIFYMQRKSVSRTRPLLPINQPSHIQHQLDIEACRCKLCQRTSIERMMIIRREITQQIIEQKYEAKLPLIKLPFYQEFLSNYQKYSGKLKRPVRLAIPQICVFERSQPVAFLSKRKCKYSLMEEFVPLRVHRSPSGSHSSYQVLKFIWEGFLCHNRLASKIKQQLKGQSLCVARYTNNPGQLLTLSMLQSLLKSKQKAFRMSLLYIQCLVSGNSYEEIRERISIDEIKEQDEEMFQRAKNQISMVCEGVKRKDDRYYSEEQEHQYEETLKRESEKEYLRYTSLKLILLHSYKTSKLIRESVMKFVKGPPESSPTYCLVDWQVISLGHSKEVWGIIIDNYQVQMDNRMSKVLQLKPEIQDRYGHIQNSSNTNKLQRVMDQLFESQKSELLGDRLKIKPKGEKEFLNTSLPDINLKHNSVDNQLEGSGFKTYRNRQSFKK